MKRYIDASELVKRRHKKYDKDLLESETINFFIRPRGLLSYPLSQDPSLTHLAEIEKRNP
jgi:hypothetical protein